MMKIRIVIEYHENTEGQSSTRWRIVSPTEFPISAPYLAGILEDVKMSVLMPPNEHSEHYGDENPKSIELANRIDALLDEYEETN